MSCFPSRGGSKGRRQRGGEEKEEEGLDSYCDRGIKQMTCRHSGKPLERHLEAPYRPEMASGSHLWHGHQIAPTQSPRNSSLSWQERRLLLSQRNLSPSWQEERRLPTQRKSSPGWQEEGSLADSDTLPARWRNVQLTKKEAQDAKTGQPTSNGAKVHWENLPEGRQRTPESDDGKEESGSSSGDSHGGSMANVEKGESEPDDRDLALSYYLNVIEHEGYGSEDEDGFVRVPRGRRSCEGGLSERA